MQDIPEERRTKSCLSDEEIVELCRQAKRIEAHFGVSQDIEWAIDEDIPFPENVYFVQARPETVWSKKKATRTLDTKKAFGQYDIVSLLNK